MEEKYIATAMKKTTINDEESIYSVDEIIAGNIDEETKILTDANGKEYLPLSSAENKTDITNYYSNMIEVEEMEELFGGEYSFRDALTLYERICREKLYLMSEYDERTRIKIVVDKGPYIEAIKQIQQMEVAKEQKIEDIIIDLTPCECETKDKDEDEDTYIDTLKKLQSEIVDGKYDQDRLLDIQNQLEEEMEEVEATIETIEIQLDMLEAEFEAKQESSANPKDSKNSNQVQKKKSQTEEINIIDVFDKVTKTLIAQDEPARRVIVELARLDEMRKKDYGILLTGESGVGKTLFMTLLARHMNRPLLKIDATQLTAPGFVGRDIEEYLWELYENCNYNKELAEKAIVFFDEIDKKGSEKKSDISGQAVLNTLLTFISGETYLACKHPNRPSDENSTKINTSNMLVVAGGAFLDVYTKPTQKQSLGFTSSTSSEKESEEHKEPEISDFIEKAQMSKEFMGRVPIIVKMNSLNIDSIRKILLESDESILKLQEEIFGKRGVKLTTQDGYIMEISQAALDRKIGARGLNKLISDTTWKAYDDVCSNPNKYEEIILTKETANDPSSYQYVKTKQN